MEKSQWNLWTTDCESIIRNLKWHLSNWQTRDSTGGPITYPTPRTPRSASDLSSDFLNFRPGISHSSFVHLAIRNEFFFYLRLAALCLLFWGPRLRCPSIGICQMTLATEYSCHARAPWFVWGFLLRYDKASIRLYVHICTWGGNRPTSCRIFWHIIWICANLELPFPAGHLSGPNALHDKRKHCFPIPVHLVPSHLTSHLIQLLQLPCPRWLTGFRAPSDWLLWMPPMARHLSSLVCRARRCHKLGQSQLSSTERNLWCFWFWIRNIFIHTNMVNFKFTETLTAQSLIKIFSTY